MAKRSNFKGLRSYLETVAFNPVILLIVATVFNRDRWFPGEAACRQFFEAVIRSGGRKYPHCQFDNSFPLRGISLLAGTVNLFVGCSSG